VRIQLGGIGNFNLKYNIYDLNRIESVAFEFGSADGVLIYNFPPDRRPDSKNDVLTFGFITVQENAVLVRAVSASSTDYLQLELVTFRNKSALILSFTQPNMIFNHMNR